MASTLFYGNILHINKDYYDRTYKSQETNTKAVESPSPIELFETYYLGVDNEGIINYFSNIEPSISKRKECEWVEDVVLKPEQVIMPGFVDTHVHAAQIQYAGTGTDLPLMKWLEKHAFPSEKRLTNNLSLAKETYNKLVNKLLSNGTTTCLYFAVLGLESTKILANVCHEKKQRAFIGKVNMDRLCPPDYIETTEESLLHTEKFIQYVKNDINSKLIKPVVTPRFVPCCTKKLLNGLGEIVQKYENLHVQSHAVESLDCLSTVEMLHPSENEVDILNESGLLTNHSVMAHCVHINEEQANTFLTSGTSIAHCPLSNFYFAGGCLRTSSLLKRKLKVGLGTDIAGGYSCQMLNSIRHCVTTHLAIAAADSNNKGVKSNGIAPGFGDVVQRDDFNYKDALWLATVGGAKALNISDTVGHFECGLNFDACLINYFKVLVRQKHHKTSIFILTI